MKKKKRYLKVKTKYWSRDKTGFKSRKYFFQKFERDSVRSYFNWHHRLIEASPASISLLFFLAENMDDQTNEIRHDKKTIGDYLTFISKIGRKPYTVAAVKKSFQQLKREALIISTPNRGIYRVNPRFLYKGSEGKRRECLQSLMDMSQEPEWADTNIFKALGYGKDDLDDDLMNVDELNISAQVGDDELMDNAENNFTPPDPDDDELNFLSLDDLNNE